MVVKLSPGHRTRVHWSYLSRVTITLLEERLSLRKHPIGKTDETSLLLYLVDVLKMGYMCACGGGGGGGGRGGGDDQYLLLLRIHELQNGFDTLSIL